MAYTLTEAAGASATDNSVTVSARTNGDWTDSFVSGALSQPQTKNISTDDDGFVDSITVDFQGGEQRPYIGNAIPGTGEISIDATGFRPNAQLTVESFGGGYPSGSLSSVYGTNEADSSGRLTGGTGQLWFQPDGSNPSSNLTWPWRSVVIRDNTRVAATLGGFPGPLWGSLYYAIEGVFDGPPVVGRTIKLYRGVIGGVYSLWIINEYLPPRSLWNSEFNAYSDTLYAGLTDTHTAIPDSVSSARVLMSGREYDLRFNSVDFRYGRASQPEDAVFIRPVGSRAQVTIEYLEQASKHTAPMAYKIKSDGTYLEPARSFGYRRSSTILQQGELLMITSVQLGGDAKILDWFYPFGATIDGPPVVDSGSGESYYKIPTRKMITRPAPGGSVTYSTAIKPGRSHLRIKVFA